MNQPPATPPSDRARVRRVAKRGIYDFETIAAIIDEAPICQVGFIHDRSPVVIPMVHWRDDRFVYLHGATSSRIMRTLTNGEACLSFTLLDGFVLARSAFHHSMNYRSVTAFGTGKLVEDEAEKERLFRVFLEKWWPGRYDEARKPNETERKATAVVGFDLSEASAKIRTGPPVDDDADMDLPVWAGVIPTTLEYGAPMADPNRRRDEPLPHYLLKT